MTTKVDKKNKTKRKVQTKKKCPRSRSKEEIISKEELNKRAGITGNITLYLITILKLHFAGHIHYHNSNKMKDLARFVLDQKILYVPKHGGFKLMEFSSIVTELSALKKHAKEEYDREKEEQRLKAEKLKSKYR